MQEREREVKGNVPYESSSGSGEWVTAHKVYVVRGKGKEIYGKKMDGIT
jgi:hypothetical protein